ncbi:oligopeptide ABC transporter permease [Entomoplasma ellychniae]|uniref:Oligopeptide ABC transporter permease n=1 Tax=Entomoplasma ellychniae TaxID=2114 RepID=A0A8E2QYV0_9MOLU|nr:oligopeptide ABC transporter permease OppB [Entomoplasma ellychniae]PPE04390.1 oligopeptide ABC transporter permease [Entomoplasma ellychniae]
MQQTQKELQVTELINEVSLTVTDSEKSNSILQRIPYHFNKLKEGLEEFTKHYPLLTYSLKRIFFSIITVYITIAVVYCLLNFLIDDTTLMIDISDKSINQNGGITGEWYLNRLATRKEKLGLDKPLIIQVLVYLRNVTPVIPKQVTIITSEAGSPLTIYEPVTKWFYLGISLSRDVSGQFGKPVSDMFIKAMPLSFLVGGTGTLLSFCVGIPLGIFVARKKDKPVDTVITTITLAVIAIPVLVIIIPFYQFTLVYLGGNTSWDQLSAFGKIFPIIAIMILVTPGVLVETRRLVIDEMTSDYTKFANSKGLSETYVFYVHVFRNSFIRMARNIPTIFLFTIFGSSILIETMWGMKGMSYYMVRAINFTDIFTVLGFVTLSASLGIMTTLVGDLLLAILDPRVSLK